MKSLFATVSLAALALQAAPVLAQTAPQGPAVAAADETTIDEVIVTGVAKSQRRFDASFAVTALSQEDIVQLAPLNFADLLSQVPGVLSEATGGEVQNVYRLRGIPNEGSFQAFHEDGMPIYQDNDGAFFKGDVLSRIDIMTETVEFVRGGPAPVYASNASAIYNQITRRGTDVPEAAVRVTLGDTGLYRVDGYWAGPVAEDTYLAAGGFLRTHEGYRPSGFPTDEGGQFRANLVRTLNNGELRLSFKYLNDHNVFMLPIPVADPRNPSVSLDPYIDFFEGTLNSERLQNARLLYSNGAGGTVVEDRDLSSGRHTEYVNLGLDYEGQFGAWTISNKLRYTDGSLSFDALYSTSNPTDATTFANGFLSAASAAFNTPTQTVSRLGYATVGSNGQTPFNVGASGLVISGQYRAIGNDFQSLMNDSRISRSIETGLGTHDIAAGLYLANYQADYSQRYQDYLFELASNPRTIDLIAYSAAGAVLGSVTDDGVLRYSTTITAGSSDTSLVALYFADNWQITDSLRVDFGVRHERYDASGFGIGQTTVNLGDPTTLADNATRAFTGIIIPSGYEEQTTPWTVGVNYDFRPWLGAYARASKAYRIPGEFTIFTNGAPLTTEAQQYEAGLKLSVPTLSAYVTGFYTKFEPFNASFLAFNPVTGANNQVLTFIGEAESPGVEVDIDWSPVDWFDLAATFTISDPTISNLVNEFKAPAAAVEGNQLIREPKTYGNIRPTVNFSRGALFGEVYLRYNFVGDRYVDLQNQTLLPAYQTLAAGITLNHGGWQVQLVGENLTEEAGLTEGNPRTDQLSGQGTREAIYGRPLFGRNFRLVTTFRW